MRGQLSKFSIMASWQEWQGLERFSLVFFTNHLWDQLGPEAASRAVLSNRNHRMHGAWCRSSTEREAAILASCFAITNSWDRTVTCCSADLIHFSRDCVRMNIMSYFTLVTLSSVILEPKDYVYGPKLCFRMVSICQRHHYSGSERPPSPTRIFVTSWRVALEKPEH